MKIKNIILWAFTILIVIMATDALSTTIHETVHFIRLDGNYTHFKGIWIDRGFLGGGELVYDNGCVKDGEKFWASRIEDVDGNRETRLIIDYDVEKEEKIAYTIGYISWVIFFSMFMIILVRWRKNGTKSSEVIKNGKKDKRINK